MDSRHFCTYKYDDNNMKFLISHSFRFVSHGFVYHILTFRISHFLYTSFLFHMVALCTYTFTLFTYTFTHEHIHITHYTLHILGVVTHSPNHQRRAYTHHITHRRHLGIPMTTLGLRRLGEQVSTLTSGTCPPPGFPPNALRVTYTLNFLRGTFP
ncbi:hypothetical protein Taro_002640 [Colocasia esculenta]|uniref:Uncharacterized protein n=1 Tax=Colocasia esculenta TaxID=4460 RepID=A0A843THN6_COLES|nr:hypothetical protein [Colocasia esculenta]